MKVFHVEPMGKPRMTRADKRPPKRPAVARYHAFQDLVRLQAGFFLPRNDDSIRFFIPMPKSWSKKKSDAHYLKLHAQRPDLDNLLKAFWDCFGEDCHLASVYVMKQWVRHGEERIEVS